MILTAKLVAGASVAAFAAGFFSGTVFVYNRWNVANLAIQAAQYRQNLEALNKITGENKKIDEDTEAIRRTNNDLLRKIDERFKAKPTPAAVDGDPECIDADSMQDIRGIR